MNNDNQEDKPKVQAENNSVAVGSIMIDGDMGGSITIGNVYNYASEEDIPLTSDEIENGLLRFAAFLPERAPILQERFSSIEKKLRATLGADVEYLSPMLKTQREDAVDQMKLMSMEVLDISFQALCKGQNPPPYDHRSPFRGLLAFRLEDKDFYFGRETLIGKLIARLKQHPFLAVLGPSGSGKSSLVMAGLIPALGTSMAGFTPTATPLHQLHAAQESADKESVFVVDQFEELFTLTHDLYERGQFISELIDLTKTHRVVITMRADFWGEVAIYEDLKQLMQEHQELIPPMNTDELHSAMNKQAAAVGLRFDQLLSESILEDVKGEPGAMPLLQHALWMLWKRRHGLYLKAEEYQDFGGVNQAIASTAEDVYTSPSRSEFEQERIRDIFLRLTRLDETDEKRDTRRRALIQELIPANSDRSATVRLLDELADAGLIVKSKTEVEVAHEALIRHWKRLIGWLHEDRDNLRLREDVSEAGREWDAFGRDESRLIHRGARLELALTMSKLPKYQLNPTEQSYLDKCVAIRERERSARESLRKRIWAGLSAGIVIAVVLAGIAVYQMLQAQNQANIALARQLASDAQFVNTGQSSKQLIGTLLSIQSMKLFPTDAAANFLRYDNFAALPIARMAHDYNVTSVAYNRVTSVAFTADGRYVVSASFTNILVSDSSTGNEVARIIHDGGVRSVALSPDGKYVVSGGDAIVRIWEVASGKEIRRMAHDDYVTSVAFSPDGKLVISGSGDATARVWEVSTGRETKRMTHKFTVNSVAFSPDGKYVASGSEDATACVWEASTGREVACMFHDFGVNSVAFSPDGKHLVSGSEDATVRVWDTSTVEEIARVLHDESVTSVAFSPDGRYIVSGSQDDTARVWNVSTGKEVARMTHDNVVTSVAFSPDSKSVVSGSLDTTVRVWKISTSRESPPMHHDYGVALVAFSADGKYVVSGSDAIVRIWEVASGKEIRRMTHEDDVTSVAFSPDGHQVVSGSDDSTVRVWDASTGQEIARMTHDDVVTSVAFSPDGKYVVAGSWDGTARVWEVSTGKELARMMHDANVASVAFSPDGSLVVSGSWDGTARVWNASTGQEIARATQILVSSVAFSPEGNYVVSGGLDWNGSVHVWDAFTGKEIARMKSSSPVDSVAFSPDGKYVLSAGQDATARVWNAFTGKELARMTHDDVVTSVAFSPASNYVVSGSNDNTARVWEATTGKEIARITHKDDVSSVAFSPDGSLVVSGSWDRTARVLVWHPADLIANACAHLPRNLARAEWEQYIGDALPYQPVCANLPVESEPIAGP